MLPPSRKSRLAGLSLLTSSTFAAAYYLSSSDTRKKQTLLSPSRFTPCTVTSVEISSPDTKLITLTLPPHLVPTPLPPVWSIFIKDDDIQVERPYTPLKGIEGEGNMSFWIKKYPSGEVGRWIHSKKVGDIIEVRGPLQTWEWKEDTWDHVIMISGGTGITPFFQLFFSVISKTHVSPKTRFTLLHSSRTPGDLPPASMLVPLMGYAVQAPGRLNMQIFVDDLPPSEQGSKELKSLFTPLVKKIDKSAVQSALLHRPPSELAEVPPRTLVLVCGPEPMIAAIAGAYGRNFSQGPIGGILKELGFTSAEVRKL